MHSSGGSSDALSPIATDMLVREFNGDRAKVRRGGPALGERRKVENVVCVSRKSPLP